MVIENFEQLLEAIFNAWQRCPHEDEYLQRNWYFNDMEMLRLKYLLDTYTDALENPPQGVIGVGAITYAEGVLKKVQWPSTSQSLDYSF